MRSLLLATAQRASRRPCWASRSTTSEGLRMATTTCRRGTSMPLLPAAVSQSSLFSTTTTVVNLETSALAKTSRDGVVGHPIDFDVNSKVEGNESQIVTITLEPGQVLRAEVRVMSIYGRPLHHLHHSVLLQKLMYFFLFFFFRVVP